MTTTASELVTKTSKLNCVTNPSSCPIAHSVQVVADSYLLPLVIVIGMLGNALNLRVLTRKELRSPTTTFLRAMAVADTLVLALQLPHLLALLVLNTKFASSGFNVFLALYYPYIRFPLTNMVLTFSVYNRVAVTLERTLAFNTSSRASLLRRKACCFFGGSRGTHLFLGLLAGVSALINFHKCFYFHHVPLDEVRANNTLQELIPRGSELQKAINKVSIISWVSLAISSVIPSVLLVIFTSVILVRLYRYRQVVNRLHQSHSSRHNSSGSNSISSIRRTTIDLPPPLPLTARPITLRLENDIETELVTQLVYRQICNHNIRPIINSDPPKLKTQGSTDSERSTFSSSNRVSLLIHQNNLQRERERRRRREIRLAATVTIMVSTVVLVFVATAAPNIYLEVVINLFTRDVALADQFTMAIRFISNLCVFFNCGANFLLFCFTSAQYRHLFVREMRDLICAATCGFCFNFPVVESPLRQLVVGGDRLNPTLADDSRVHH